MDRDSNGGSGGDGSNGMELCDQGDLDTEGEGEGEGEGKRERGSMRGGGDLWLLAIRVGLLATFIVFCSLYH